MTREYASRSEAFLPDVGERVLIQWGQDSAQSNFFVVESRSNELWADKDCVSFYLKYAE